MQLEDTEKQKTLCNEILKSLVASLNVVLNDIHTRNDLINNHVINLAIIALLENHIKHMFESISYESAIEYLNRLDRTFTQLLKFIFNYIEEKE